MSFLSGKYLALTIGDVEIDLSRSKDDTTSTTNLMGVVRAADDETIKLDKTFAASLSPDVVAIIPAGLSISIKNVLYFSTHFYQSMDY